MTPSQILCELIAIPSVNPMGRKLEGPIYFEHRLSDWLVEYFESIGVAHERIEVAPGRANILARYDSPGAQRTLLLDAHQDTVPVDGMTIPPFEPRIADGRITGRGASDVKGGMAAMLHAFTRLVKEKPGGAANVVLSCELLGTRQW
jgi:succinyl-diaminopimelate desuccinylase